jgi:hypothetical protein
MTSAAQCVVCAPGTSCPLGTEAANVCPAGSVQPEAGRATCISCATGTYQSTAGMTACDVCAPGHWCMTSLQVPCGENKWNNESGSYDPRDCMLCPIYSTTAGETSATGPGSCTYRREDSNLGLFGGS